MPMTLCGGRVRGHRRALAHRCGPSTRRRRMGHASRMAEADESCAMEASSSTPEDPAVATPARTGRTQQYDESCTRRQSAAAALSPSRRRPRARPLSTCMAPRSGSTNGGAPRPPVALVPVPVPTESAASLAGEIPAAAATMQSRARRTVSATWHGRLWPSGRAEGDQRHRQLIGAGAGAGARGGWVVRAIVRSDHPACWRPTDDVNGHCTESLRWQICGRLTEDDVTVESADLVARDPELGRRRRHQLGCDAEPRSSAGWHPGVPPTRSRGPRRADGGRRPWWWSCVMSTASTSWSRTHSALAGIFTRSI